MATMDRIQANGWVLFAAVMLFMTGVINFIHGVVGVFTPDYYVATSGEVLFFNFTVWGVLLAVWGLLLIAAGFALASRQTWARVLGIVLAAINLIAQVAFIAAYPWWSLAAIVIDVLVIYALTAGWNAGTEAAYRSGQADAAAGAHIPSQQQKTRGEHVR